MKKSILILALAATATLSAAVLTSCTDYPDFINPTETDTTVSGTESGRYVITVTSEGGFKLDGVRVTASKYGKEVASGISKNGQVALAIDPDEYDLSFDSLPDGYSEGSTRYKTNAEELAYTVTFSSTLISSSAVSSTRYVTGDVMHDFTYRGADGETHKLSDVFSTKKAVILNFWYADCLPCRSEFPYLESAYTKYSDDVEVIALTNKDTVSRIASFQDEYGLTFLMGQDTSGIYNLFSVEAYPTTVVIDRYGVIAERHVGSQPSEQFFTQLFAAYTSSNYSQSGITSGSSSEDGDSETWEWAAPTVSEPDYTSFTQAVASDSSVTFAAETSSDDKDSSWPFVLDEEDGTTYLKPSNVGTNLSFATVYVTFNLKANDIITYEYKVNTEDGNDVLYVLMDEEVLFSYSGSTNGWVTQDAFYVADKTETVTLAFLFRKDNQETVDDEFVGLKNFVITTVDKEGEALDVLRPIATGRTSSGYQTYLDVSRGENDVYYYLTNNGVKTDNLIFTTLTSYTQWSDAHLSGRTDASSEGTAYTNGLYQIAYYQLWLSTSDSESTQQWLLNGTDYYHALTYTETGAQGIYYMQLFSETGLIPVTEEVKNLLVDFTKEYCKTFNIGYYDEMWLEFCYYYDHYGSEHTGTDNCLAKTDPTVGMRDFNAHLIELESAVDVSPNATIYQGTAEVNYSFQIYRGEWYKFTAPKAGVYKFYSTVSNDNTDPELFLRNASGYVIAYENDPRVYDYFDFQSDEKNGYYYNFYLYVYLDANETVYPCFSLGGSEGTFSFAIDYMGTEYQSFVFAGDGTFDYDENYNGPTVGLDPSDNTYYILQNGELGSQVYINFLHASLMSAIEGATLKDFIEKEHYFDLTAYGKADYTAQMNEYYQQSIEGKSEEDELYGFLPASKDLVEIITTMLVTRSSSTYNDDDGAWMMLSCYYEYYNATNRYIAAHFN